MAVPMLPESVRTLSERADWFHLQACCAVERLRRLAALTECPESWADFMLLVSDDLERQAEAFEPCILELRQLETIDHSIGVLDRAE